MGHRRVAGTTVAGLLVVVTDPSSYARVGHHSDPK
jgi:hypothetical protein